LGMVACFEVLVIDTRQSDHTIVLFLVKGVHRCYVSDSGRDQ
jgi:hypothetical protein